MIFEVNRDIHHYLVHVAWNKDSWGVLISWGFYLRRGLLLIGFSYFTPYYTCSGVDSHQRSRVNICMPVPRIRQINMFTNVYNSILSFFPVIFIKSIKNLNYKKSLNFGCKSPVYANVLQQNRSMISCHLEFLGVWKVFGWKLHRLNIWLGW